MTDAELVTLLQKRPKEVPMLQSRELFRRFFAGLTLARMTSLLQQAYAELPEAERDDKVAKRLALLQGLLT